MLSFLRNNPLFLRYWISLWCSEVGDSIRNMVLLFWVLNLSHHSAVAVSISMFCEYAPIFLLGSLIGVFVDRWNRKRTMVYANLFRALMVVFFILALLLHSLFMIYIGAFVCSIGTIFFRSPSPGFITLLVPNQDDRRMASSLRQVSMSVMLLIGPPLGTVLYVYIGGSWSLVINGFLFLISTLLLSRIPLSEHIQMSDKPKEATISGVLKDMKDGFHYSWIHRCIRSLLVSCAFLGFGAGLIQVMYIFVITDFLQLPETMYGTVSALEGLTSLVSVFFIGNAKLSGEKLLILGMLLLGVGLGGTVLIKSLFILCFFTIVFSIGQIALNMGIAIIMQLAVHFAFQGRVGTIINTVLVGFMTISMMCSGWLHNAFTVRPVVAGGGLLIVLGAIVCYLMLQSVISTQENQLDIQG